MATVTGGVVNGALSVSNSAISLSGGQVSAIHMSGNSSASISGGFVASFNAQDSNSTATLVGGEFRVNGVPIEGLETIGNTIPLNLPTGAILSGILADGTPFVFWNKQNGVHIPMPDGTLTLKAAALPAADPIVILAPSDPIPLGLRDGQKLIVDDGGYVRDFFIAGPGSTIEVTGGQIAKGFRADGAVVTIENGSIDSDSVAFGGSTLNILGGSVGWRLQTYDTTVNISGGRVASNFNASAGSTVNITGGSVDGEFVAESGSEVSIRGGELGELMAKSGATANISDGAVGDLDAEGVVNISGGNFFNVNAKAGSTVSISGGIFNRRFNAYSNLVNIAGGEFRYLEAFDGSVVNISGGSIGDGLKTRGGGTINLSGGTVGEDFDALYGSHVNLFGVKFILGGTDITASLTANNPLTITDRNVTLEGSLADGSPFSFDLNSANNSTGEDYFSSAALLTITLVTPGDFNFDGIVDAADYVVWRKTGGTQQQYEIFRRNFGQTSESGAGAAGSASSPVPEPPSVMMVLVGMLAILMRERAFLS